MRSKREKERAEAARCEVVITQEHAPITDAAATGETGVFHASPARENKPMSIKRETW